MTFDPQDFEAGCLNKAWNKLVKWVSEYLLSRKLSYQEKGILQQCRPLQSSFLNPVWTALNRVY